MSVSIRTEDFDVSRELALLRAGRPDVGAIVSFVGTVRDFGGDPALSEMFLEYYPGMTEKALADILDRAKSRWSLLAARIVHRVGVLRPSEQIVLAAVAARHRAEAFAACEFIMDSLKLEAPFWKKETDASGSRWVDVRESDVTAAGKWQTGENAGKAGA